eukprot:2135796-Amphidinium_carterae.1
MESRTQLVEWVVAAVRSVSGRRAEAYCHRKLRFVDGDGVDEAHASRKKIFTIMSSLTLNPKLSHKHNVCLRCTGITGIKFGLGM